MDRYSQLRHNGSVHRMPMVSIPKKNSDYFETYQVGVTRLDNVSYKYYGDPNYDWLILMANKEYGSMEFSIPDGSILRIPYPLELSLDDFNNQINKYKTLYER